MSHARALRSTGRAVVGPRAMAVHADTAVPAAAAKRVRASGLVAPAGDQPTVEEIERLPPGPGLADIEAAAALVAAGISPRVQLIGLRTWPGLLSQAQDIAAEAGVLIVAVRVSAEGRVDLQVTLDQEHSG
ncbi:MAG: hypothetical protein ACXWNG_01910 [Candidatus Limnocylindrales bacterium]